MWHLKLTMAQGRAYIEALMYKVTREFKHSQDGLTVTTYHVGDHAEMPQAAVDYGIKHGFIEVEKPKATRKPRKPNPDLEHK